MFIKGLTVKQFQIGKKQTDLIFHGFGRWQPYDSPKSERLIPLKEVCPICFAFFDFWYESFTICDS